MYGWVYSLMLPLLLFFFLSGSKCTFSASAGRGGGKKATVLDRSMSESLTHLQQIIGFALETGLNFSICALPEVS